MRSWAALALLLVLGTGGEAQQRYLGLQLGALSQLHHAVRGSVYAVDARTLYLHDFHYDGEGPAAYFYVGTSKAPSSSGALRLRDERGGAGPLRRYRGEGVTLSLPEGKTLRDVRWFSVWCDEYAVNFGSVSIPRDAAFPRPAKLGALRGVHGVSSDPLVVVDAQTLLVPNFSYDGEAPDAKFWVGRGDKPSPQGIRIPDENGKETPLRRYDRKTIVLTLPGELTVFDIGHFAVWCEAFTVNFGHVPLPRAALANVPPSLKMLGVSPQSKLNCEVLLDELAFEVRWAVAGDSIVLQLVGKLEDGEYMSFGVSGDAQHSQMVGADVAVAWVDKDTLRGHAVDYYLDAKSQCAGVRGSCPDERLGEKTNSIRLLNAALVNGYSIVTYQRPLRAQDELDRAVLTNGSQPVIWALGPLNSRGEVSYHHHFTKGDKLLEFGRPPVWNCPMPEGEEPPPQHDDQPHGPQTEAPRPVETSSVAIKPNPVPTPRPVPKAEPWEIPAIQCYEPPDGVFYAQMGPTGGKQGYSAITGHVGWGISWYINGLLIPEINVVRGRKYTFVVEGGNDPDTPARYHPFYITNDPVGGYFHKTDEEKKGVEIYAGVRRSRGGELTPTGTGRLCNWTPDSSGPQADEFPSFGAYQRSLTLVCEEGSPGVVVWTPGPDTPDTVYYQCFTHRYLGWKINVLDECDEEGEESRVVERVAAPEDLQQQESVQVHSRLPPADNFLDHRTKLEKIINTKTTYNDFSSDKDDDVLTGEVRPTAHREFELPAVTTGQMRDVIRTVESMESRLRAGLARNASRAPAQYQVYEEDPDSAPERPLREDDEYVVSQARPPFFLPHDQKPLTLQSVLRPGPNRQNIRPPFRRPVPPEIKLRRPTPMYSKPASGYPLPMPTANQNHGLPKKPYGKTPYGRPHGMGRPPQSNVPPMKAMPPLPHGKPMFYPGMTKQASKIQNGPMQTIIMGKPSPPPVSAPSHSQTLSLGHTDFVVNQVVKSQITLPGSGEPIAQSSSPMTFISQPDQIILGKPMDNPVPLDQQMAPAKHHNVRLPPTPPPQQKTTTLRIKIPNDQSPPSDVKSSDFIGESSEPVTFQPAVNTGFKPNTIVIESGFKPIIREPLMDRVGDYDDGGSNRREDTDVEDDYGETPQYISNHAYETPSDKMTQSFEPMFIPSPPDHLLPTHDRTKEIFPKNHAKEDRPHPVYVKTENELNALFSKKNMEKEVPSDMIMESDRVSPQYLPPDPKLPKEHSQKLSTDEETFTTYDGKTVSASTLISVPDTKPSKLFSSKLPANSELLLKTPQFGPFKGEIPPLVGEQIKPADAKNATSDTRTTHLKLVNAFKADESEDEGKDDLKAEGSEQHEVKAGLFDEEEDDNEEDQEDVEDLEEYDEDEKSLENRRRRRETKTTQFQRGEVQPTPVAADGGAARQADFEAHPSTSRASRLYWSSLVLLTLCLRLF